MIVTLEPDGRLIPNPSGAPTSWLPDGTGFRVVMRFIQAAEGLITYNGLLAGNASYNAVVTWYADYNAILSDSSLAINSDVDVACVCSGTALHNGRTGLFSEIEAGTLDLSIIDRTGLFDPRNTDTPLGPGRRVRSGTWVQVSVWLYGKGWRPMFTGLVDTWSREIERGAHRLVGRARFMHRLFRGVGRGHVQRCGARATHGRTRHRVAHRHMATVVGRECDRTRHRVT